MPGTLVLIGLNSPRIFEGASGFGSQMSMWLGPPCRKMKMTDLALPQPLRCLLGSGWSLRRRLQPQHVGQREAEDARAADAKEFTAAPTVARCARVLQVLIA